MPCSVNIHWYFVELKTGWRVWQYSFTTICHPLNYFHFWHWACDKVIAPSSLCAFRTQDCQSAHFDVFVVGKTVTRILRLLYLRGTIEPSLITGCFNRFFCNVGHAISGYISNNDTSFMSTYLDHNISLCFHFECVHTTAVKSYWWQIFMLLLV